MMRAYRATCWVSMLSVTLVLLLGGRAGTAHADDIDDAAGRPYAEAVEALETLLDSARQANELERMTRIRRSLATRHLQAADLDAALPPLESLAHQSEATVADKVIYAEVLLGIARINIQASAFGRKVHPFLRDAVDILAPLPLRAEAVPAAEIRGRLVLALTEAHWLLGEHGRALDVVTRGRQDPLPAALTPALSDFEARARYAQQDYEGAARAFLVAGNPMGAAAAFDAARKPEASLPLYAAAIAAAPEDEATLERALAAVRFHKAHAQFLDA
ncbi:MAG: hypothetical protein O2894_10600, partial [Planctomycetota bacterium]|nr:hypothetical protein [Planctomycetota bacterium]